MSGARIGDGAGGAINVATGVPVLDHLLTELARAGGFDLTLEIEPDDPEAEVDAAGTALGRAVRPRLADGALGEATVPADEALAMVVVERSERPLVASNADLTGAGGLGTDLAARFLGRLSEEAGLTVHVRLMEGDDTGHALAAIFKALGVALARATAAKTDGGDEVEKAVIRTEAAPAPFQGAPYNQAIVAGELVFVAGQLGLVPGAASVEGDIGAQTAQALANLAAILEAAGSSMDKLVKTSVFLADLGDFEGMNEVYATRVGDRPPARSTFEVARLPSGALVEIEAIAHL
jgi:2-iminobutanoate/2-iminopropanoate deaminase